MSLQSLPHFHTHFLLQNQSITVTKQKLHHHASVFSYLNTFAVPLKSFSCNTKKNLHKDGQTVAMVSNRYHTKQQTHRQTVHIDAWEVVSIWLPLTTTTHTLDTLNIEMFFVLLRREQVLHASFPSFLCLLKSTKKEVKVLVMISRQKVYLRILIWLCYKQFKI